ncbi:unnamed protein product [Discosporangium mesarthrocarpum]
MARIPGVALVAVYRSTRGETWRESDNWLNDHPLHQWLGIGTTSTGYVKTLKLRNNLLHGKQAY